MGEARRLTAERLLGAARGWWERRDTAGEDGLLALVVSALAFAPTISALGAQIGDLPQHPGDALGVVLTLAQTLPLAIRRRLPALCLSVVGGAFAAHQALGYPTTFGSLGLYLALYSVGAHQARGRTATAAGAASGYLVLALILHHRGSPQSAADFGAFGLSLVAAWLVGGSVRRRRAAEEQRQQLAVAAAASAERARIARDLHDVVTHHVTAMVIQADAAQFLLSSAPDRAARGLSAVSDTGRQALTELRRLLGVLEATGESATAIRVPSFGSIAELVEQARRSGQPVEFTEGGEPRPQPADVRLACYRVVQEALTNAMKYAAGRSTDVRLRYGEEFIEIEVNTAGPTTNGQVVPPSVPSGGRGLTGLRERLRLLDGSLDAGPRPGGGFRVRAVIPCKPADVSRSTADD